MNGQSDKATASQKDRTTKCKDGTDRAANRHLQEYVHEKRVHMQQIL
jgi:hypothetical protein